MNSEDILQLHTQTDNESVLKPCASTYVLSVCSTQFFAAIMWVLSCFRK